MDPTQDLNPSVHKLKCCCDIFGLNQLSSPLQDNKRMRRTLEEEQRARKELERIVRRVLKNMNDPTWDETNLWDRHASDQRGQDPIFTTFKGPNNPRSVAQHMWVDVANSSCHYSTCPDHSDLHSTFVATCAPNRGPRENVIPTDRNAVKPN